MTTFDRVLVLGAGASAHLGYPLGGALTQQICDTACGGYVQDGLCTNEEGAAFTNLLQASDLTIDQLLERFPVYSRLGKAAIVYAIRRYEDIAMLHNRNRQNWYRELRSLLLDESGKWRAHRTAIVTFNYDRSIEAFLAHWLAAGRAKSLAHAFESVQGGVSINHLYGTAGKPGIEPYGSSIRAADAARLSEEIYTMFEERAGSKAQEQFAAARDTINSSERVLFLGFGFDKSNLERLGVDWSRFKERGSILCTTHDMSRRRQSQLFEGLSALGFNRSAYLPINVSCNELVEHIGFLDVKFFANARVIGKMR
jgi:hypothetical protein